MVSHYDYEEEEVGGIRRRSKGCLWAIQAMGLSL
jgi:hypothetical protein